jgi:hypothetical protein
LGVSKRRAEEEEGEGGASEERGARKRRWRPRGSWQGGYRRKREGRGREDDQTTRKERCAETEGRGWCVDVRKRERERRGTKRRIRRKERNGMQ